MSRSRLAIDVQKAVDSKHVPPPAQLRRWIRAAAGDVHGELAVRIVGHEESAALNARYRARSGPTNVLSFPADVPHMVFELEPRPLGDLVICAPVVEREADEQGKALDAHWAHIVMHGTLHLLGYDHEEEAAAREMEDRERELLAGFGFGDPYTAKADNLNAPGRASNIR